MMVSAKPVCSAFRAKIDMFQHRGKALAFPAFSRAGQQAEGGIVYCFFSIVYYLAGQQRLSTCLTIENGK
jgi:hypothetical protein